MFKIWIMSDVQLLKRSRLSPKIALVQAMGEGLEAGVEIIVGEPIEFYYRDRIRQALPFFHNGKERFILERDVEWFTHQPARTESETIH